MRKHKEFDDQTGSSERADLLFKFFVEKKISELISSTMLTITRGDVYQTQWSKEYLVERYMQLRQVL